MARHWTRRAYATPENAAQFGFRWGPLDVVRNMEYRGRHSLSVLTDTHEVEVGVSAKGHSVRVWLDGVEMVPKTDA